MRTKEEYYDLVLENRRLAANPQITLCCCPNTLCDWHGKCKECVALHRYHNDHVPVCLHPIINDKIRALAGVVEMLTEKEEPTPIEYRHYVKERDKMENLNLLNKEAWNAYQEDYFRFHLMERPDYFEFFSNGGVDLDEHLAPMLGDVKGLKLLDTCCACDAVQAFSWHNLGAAVTACDIAEKAVEIASKNAAKMNLGVDFIVADMQTLEPINDSQYDIVFATYPVWVQNIEEACKTWYRILKAGGKLLWHMEHPITYCIAEDKNGLHIIVNYNSPNTEIFDSFDGTPLARRQGGFHVDLQTAEHFWRISDILNAVCNAGFRIVKVHEDTVQNSTDMNLDYEPKDPSEEIEMRKLPSEFTVLAIK